MFKICRKGSNINTRTEPISSSINSNNHNINTNYNRNNRNNINNNSYGTSTINYEIENSFLRKENELLQKEIVNKLEYIKTLDLKYKEELDYINNSLTNDYNRIVNDLYEENKSLSNTIIKISNDKFNLEKEIKKQYSQMSHVDNFMCNICLDNFKNILLEPCNHLCCCDECYYNSSITECPLCRKDILATKKVFL
jgi:hypothetical protein